jgi:hypothetical protein
LPGSPPLVVPGLETFHLAMAASAMNPTYEKNTTGWTWWCRTHRREATHLLKREGCSPVATCDPALGGILLPCDCVCKNWLLVVEAKTPPAGSS